jgi:hypothetical protein
VNPPAKKNLPCAHLELLAWELPAFFLFEAVSGCECRRKAGFALFARKVVVGPSVFVFGSSGYSNKE